MRTQLLIAILITACSGEHPTSPDANVTIDAAPPQGDASTDTGPARLRAVVIIGQSNARGIGIVSELPGSDYAYPPLPFSVMYGNFLQPQIQRTYTGALTPLCIKFLATGSATSDCPADDQSFGIELSLASALGSGWVIGKYTADGTSLAEEWDPTGTWCPAGPCVGSDGAPNPTMYQAYVAWQAAFLAQTGAQLAAVIWIQGEQDATTIPLATAYGGELTTFIADVRRDSGVAVPFLYGELPLADGSAMDGSALTEPGVAEVRAGEVADQDVAQGIIMVSQDGYAMTGVHFVGSSLIALGSAYATALLDAVGSADL